MTESKPVNSCWVITDSKVGMRNQCLGLASRMDLTVEEKVLHLRAPWKQFSPFLLRVGNAMAMTADSDPILPPWDMTKPRCMPS